MTISPQARQSLFHSETSDRFIVLITISHPSISTPIRVCSNSQDIISRGQAYYAYPFQLQLPDSTSDQPPKAQLQIDNVTPEIINALRTITTSPTITFEIVRAENLNVVEVSMPNFILNSIQYDALIITGDISVEQYITEPYPAGSYTPGRFPGLFGL